MSAVQIYWLEQQGADVPAADDWLSVAERDVLDRMRIPKRRADWRLGRWTAKRAVATLLSAACDPAALSTLEVRPSSSGAPRMFQFGLPMALTISITHRAGRAACAVSLAGAALGCDLELVEPRGAIFVADYFSDAEREWLAGAPEPEHPWLVTLLWSAKESALKALGAGLTIDTREVVITIGHPNYRPGESWHPFSATYLDGRVLYGWSRRGIDLVRTLVSSPPATLPRMLVTPDHRSAPGSESVPQITRK
jgi:4'-phosphopantetheinyl transferase